MNNLSGSSESLALLKEIRQLKQEILGLEGIALWENPEPTATFPAQTVNLSSANYDVYEVFYKARSNETSVSLLSARSLKGYGTELNTAFITNSTILQRAVTCISDTELQFGNAYYGTTEKNAYVKPIKIIGYKSQY